MVGRRRGWKGSCWLKHLKAQRGLTLPLGSSGVDMRIADEDNGDDDKEDKDGNGKSHVDKKCQSEKFQGECCDRQKCRSMLRFFGFS